MTPEAAGDILRERIRSSSIPVPEATPLHRAAGEIIEMALAYLNDGGEFIISGDPVNGLASYAYGLGWLDAGVYTGLISFTGNSGALPPGFRDDIIPGELRPHLEEKTGRYRRMLESALEGVAPAPDTGSPVYAAALTITGRALDEFEKGCADTALCSALWHFSYGYGWLDAGVRAGIIRITGDRSLFTV